MSKLARKLLCVDDEDRILASLRRCFSEEDFEDADVEAGIKVIDSLIGLDEYPGKEAVRYVVHTELREMIFRTTEKPQVEESDKRQSV